MRFTRTLLFMALSFVTGLSFADHLSKDAAIGGGLGGAIGGAIGAETGGRNGAILGGAVGAAIGTIITTEDDYPKRIEYEQHRPEPYIQYRRPEYKKRGHCPPGQAKKGRC